ncbi:hypothetical protein, partial [Cronobacter sakazakii]|uniref:hypothetical protein n=1 Tax=Cronobacter sakazakii TaxID=28141 RepID=UPI00294B3F99
LLRVVITGVYVLIGRQGLGSRELIKDCAEVGTSIIIAVAKKFKIIFAFSLYYSRKLHTKSFYFALSTYSAVTKFFFLKSRGRNGWVYYNADMAEQIVQRREMETSLREA